MLDGARGGGGRGLVLAGCAQVGHLDSRSYGLGPGSLCKLRGEAAFRLNSD